MKVAVLPGDIGGCGTYRLIEPAKAVQEARPDWDIRVYPPKGHVKLGLDRRGRVVQIRDLDPWPDVMVMQRTGTPVLAGAVDYLQSQGVAVVADFDDAMWCIDRGNTAFGAWNNPHRHRGQHWSWCDYVAKRADLVTVTTNHLARRYGRHGRFEVLPNRIPDRWVVEQDSVGPGVAGWAGYLKTHPGDCEVSRPAAERFDCLRVVGETPGRMGQIWGREVEGIASTPLGPDYFQALAQLGVMLVGLRQTSFNRAKSTLKVLEAAAAGVPSIAADTPPHRALAREGFPVLLASTPEEWRLDAQDLMNPSYYEQMRQFVLEALPRYLMSTQAERWAQAWERAAARSGSGKPRTVSSSN